MRNNFGLPFTLHHCIRQLQEANTAKTHWLNGTTTLPDMLDTQPLDDARLLVRRKQEWPLTSFTYLNSKHPPTPYQAYNGKDCIHSFVHWYSIHLLNKIDSSSNHASYGKNNLSEAHPWSPINDTQSNGEEDNSKTIRKLSEKQRPYKKKKSNQENRGRKQSSLGKGNAWIESYTWNLRDLRGPNTFTHSGKSLCFKEITSQAKLFHKHSQFPLENGLQSCDFFMDLNFVHFAFTSSPLWNETINPVHKIGISWLARLWFGKHPFPAQLNKALTDARSHPPVKAIRHMGCGVWTDLK